MFIKTEPKFFFSHFFKMENILGEEGGGCVCVSYKSKTESSLVSI